MQLILVPLSADQRSARLWVCAADAPAPPEDFRITIAKFGDVLVPRSGWRAVTVDGILTPAESRTWVQTVNVPGLTPHTVYRAHFGAAQARFSTLPAALPRAGEEPFKVLLASCYYVRNDRGRSIGQAIDALPETLKPDLKILCGDQVYLDFPAFVLGLPFNAAGLARSFLQKYRVNWGTEAGFGLLLRQGSSYFTADDHEFWNNYPNAATVISNTWTAAGRDTLKRAALPLFRDFQCERPADAGTHRAFRVGSLSFLIVDTRITREPGDDRFLSPARFTELINWIDNLTGPGVLVLGQPLFAKPASWVNRRLVDRALSNYGQYKDLVRTLFRARHSVLTLTGDVHYGRIATAVLLSNPSQARLHEVIASPLALVFGDHEEPPEARQFPPQGDLGAPQVPAETLNKGSRAADNFATLHFTETPGIVTARVRHWYFREGAQAGPEVELRLF